MICETCKAQLSPGEHRAGRRRCRACCTAMPRIVTVKQSRKKQAAIASGFTAFSLAKKKPKAQSGVSWSWWLDFASGPRRDEEFKARADALVPTTTSGSPTRLREGR